MSLILLSLFSYVALSDYDVCWNTGRACYVDQGECCSVYDWCGIGPDWCNEQSRYGYNPDTEPDQTGSPTASPVDTPSPTDAPVETPEYPICEGSDRVCDVANGECCGSDGFCGTSSESCNENSEYGYTTKSPTKAPVDTPEPTLSPVTSEPTSSPVAEPTPREPEIGFTGCPCMVEGDPHIWMWNCQRINYQGPHGYDPAGSFYYITPCNGFTQSNMPFNLIGSHARWGEYFTVLDYFILELYDYGITYLVRISGDGVQISTDGGTTYNDVTGDNAWNTYGMFQIQWERDYNQVVNFNMRLAEDLCDPALSISTRRFRNSVEQESAHIKLADCYKGYTCGLCGNFQNNFPFFETAEGDIITVDQGYFGPTAEDYDGFGYLIEGSRPEMPQRRLQDYQVSNMTTACLALDDSLYDKCSLEMLHYDTCCDQLDGFCERHYIETCQIDSCACIAYQMEQNNITDVDGLQADNIINNCVVNTMAVYLMNTCGVYEISDFIIPIDTLVENTGICDELVATQIMLHQQQNANAKTGKNKNGLFMMLGIIIGLVVATVPMLLAYAFCFKPKLNAASKLPSTAYPDA